MFLAMNRFRVKRGSEADFEEVWRSRDSHLDKVPGFVEFRLLKGPETEEYTLYASHTIWSSKSAFEDWTRSEAFRAAHRNAGGNKRALCRGAAVRGLRAGAGARAAGLAPAPAQAVLPHPVTPAGENATPSPVAVEAAARAMYSRCSSASLSFHAPALSITAMSMPSSIAMSRAVLMATSGCMPRI